jgi:hypothetical protein
VNISCSNFILIGHKCTKYGHKFHLHPLKYDFTCTNFHETHKLSTALCEDLCSRYSDLLRAGRSGDRIPVGARFSAPVQTGPGAYPASCTMGAGSIPGAKRPGRGIDHPPPSSAEVKERVELYLYSPSGPSWPVLGWTLPYLYRISPKTGHCQYFTSSSYWSLFSCYSLSTPKLNKTVKT